ncbi:MAG: HmuY family protein [Bacteroidota bacterium]
MKFFYLPLFVFASALFLVSCSDDEPELVPVEIDIFNDLSAPQEGGQGQPITGPFTKFNLATGQVTTSETAWDLAFRGTTIIINGGVETGIADEPARTGDAAVYIANGTMSSIAEVDVTLFRQDDSTGPAIPGGSDNGWYNYSGPPTFLITPLAGKILVMRTHDGNNYAKLEILSYYKGAPDSPDATMDEGRHYTFNYVYNPNDNVTTF